MKIALPIIIVTTIAIAAGAFVYTSTQKPKSSDSMMKIDETTMQQNRVEPKNNDVTGLEEEKMVASETSGYLVYSKTNLDNAKNTRRVLFFYANWCPTCRPADANFSENESKIPTGTTLIRVNYNDTETDQDEKDLANKYGVTYQHTFVQIDENDNVVTKWNGGQIGELLQRIK